MLDKIIYNTPSPFSNSSEAPAKIPGFICAVCWHFKTIKKTHLDIQSKVQVLFRTVEKLSISKKILEHENTGFKNVLINEEKH